MLKLTHFTLLLSLYIHAQDPLIFQKEWKLLNKQKKFDINKQSFCIKSQKLNTQKNIKLQVRPASVSKLFTTLWAFEKLGHNHQFQTRFLVKEKTLYILGGNDPFFVTENLLALMGQLEKSQKTNFDQVVFDQNFFLNWSHDPLKIKLKLESILNSTRWDTQTINTIELVQNYVEEHKLNINVPSKFKVSQVHFQDDIKVEGFLESLKHFSSPLIDHFKQVNIYSNNFYSDEVFHFLGGETQFNLYIQNRFNLAQDDTYFYTGSGLGENRTTCSTSIKVLEALKSYAIQNKIKLKNFISVAGTDAGTLAKRFKKNKNTVLAKTGTLRHTSSLAGYLGKNHSTLFAIFNHTTDRDAARSLQNNFVELIIQKQILKSFTYNSFEYLSIFNTSIKKAQVK